MTDLLQNFVHWFFSGWTPCTLLSLFDYCNCRMNAIVTTLTGRLQAVLHATIHLITGICLNYLSLRRQCLTCCTCFCQLIIYKTTLMAFNCTWCQGPEYFNNVLVPVRCVGAHAWLWSADIGDMIVPHVYILYIVNHTLSFISTNCEELSFIWTYRLISIEHSLRPVSRHCCWLSVLVAGISWELVNILIDLVIKCLYVWQQVYL